MAAGRMLGAVALTVAGALGAAAQDGTALVAVPRGTDAEALPPSVPASNPVGLVPRAAAPPPGFEAAFADGRVNPLRGVPRPVSGPVVLGARVLAGGEGAAYVVVPRGAWAD